MPYFPPKKRFDKDKDKPKNNTETPETSDLQLIYGRHLVLEALQQGISIDKVLVQQDLRGEFEKELRQACKDAGVLLQAIPKERINAITRNNHQGVLAYRSAIEYQDMETVVEAAIERGEMPLLVLLDGVTDVRNLGAIARSAEICGAHAIILPKKGIASINEDAIKASAGALNILPVCRVQNLLLAIDYLASKGIQTVASDIRGKALLHLVDFRKPTAILMGAEGRGLTPELLKKSTHIFRIPMRGKTDSFNVSVATGIILYEALKQIIAGSGA